MPGTHVYYPDGTNWFVTHCGEIVLTEDAVAGLSEQELHMRVHDLLPRLKRLAPYLNEWEMLSRQGVNSLDELEARIFALVSIPNAFIDGVLGRGLSVHAKWLYVYVKSVADENSGLCPEDTPTLARGSGMSRSKVATATQELTQRGLITVDDAGVHVHAAGNNQ